MPANSPIEAFVQLHRKLLELERATEVAEAAALQATLSPRELEQRGLALLRLKVADEGTGLGGRLVLELEPTRGGELPSSQFQPGDLALVRSAGASGGGAAGSGGAPTAVVVRVRPTKIVVALDEVPEEPLEEPLRLDRVANDVTYRRLREGLARLSSPARGPANRLREVLFGLRDPAFVARIPLDPRDSSLDSSQREAVAFALSAQDLALIHGPPGTGKTTAAVEVIRQTVARGERVLACAASNLAVDGLVERLARAGVRVVRLGHPARLLPAVVEHSLDALVEQADGTRIAGKARRELAAAQRKLRRAVAWTERRALREDVSRLRRETRALEDRAIREVLDGAEVVLATSTGAGDSILEGSEFDLVLLDEAAQALEAACWIPILRGKKVVLVGDHKQLPPTIKSQEAGREGLGVTLFDRLAARDADRTLRRLTVQYRMHRRIMTWPSAELYDGTLEAHPSVASHTLEELAGVASVEETRAPLWVIDTAGCGLEESLEAEGDSRYNEGECQLVAHHLAALFSAGVREEQVAVITPYSAQVDRLRARLAEAHPGLEVGTVDGFQGREKEAVVISLVRSNERGEVGFLADDRRTNVAVTRARRHLAVIGDSSTAGRHPFLARLFGYLEKEGEYRSAWGMV